MPTFDYDVFISYAHLDNRTFKRDQEGWIDTLHRALELRLTELLGEEVRIWRDQKLAGNDRFDQEIVDQLVRAATLVAVLSPRYVKSDWCEKEVAAFHQSAEASLAEALGNKSRIFKVVKTPVPREQHPAAVRELLGYEFFDDGGSGRPREFVRGFGLDPEPEFWDKLDDLAYELRDLIALLRERWAAAGQDASVEPGPRRSGTTIYLAEATSDLQSERDRVRRELLAQGHEVVPDRPLPLRGAHLEAVIEEHLARASLSIHLAGPCYDVVPEGHDATLTEIQCRLAAKRSREGALARLVWIPPGVEIADERQRRVVDALREDPDLGPRDSVLETGLNELNDEIGDRLRAMAEAGAAPEADDGVTVYVIFDRSDVDAVAPLEDHLWERGLEVIVPIFDGDEAEILAEHRESLRRCRAVLLFQGQATDAWLRTKLRDLRKAPADRESPFEAKAIFLASPETLGKARYRSREVDEVIHGFDAFDPQSLARFLQRLSGGGGRD